MEQSLNPGSSHARSRGANVNLDVETLLLSAVLVLAVLLPPIFPPVRMEDPLLVALLVWIGFKSPHFPAHRLSIAFVFVLALAATGSMLLAVVSGGPLQLSRIATLYLLILKYMILVWCASHVLRDWSRLRFAMIATVCAGLLSGLVAVGQYLNLGPINWYLSPIYASANQEAAVWMLQEEHLLRRAFGTSFSPNHYGFMMVALAAISLFLFSSSRKLGYLAAHLFFFVVILLTLSRTAIIAYAILVVTYHWLQSKSKIMFSAILVLFVGLALIALAGMSDFEIALLARFLEIDWSGGDEGSSWGARLAIWETALSQVQSGPWSMVFGLGPGIVLEQEIDSQYVYLLHAHGVVGLALVVGLHFWVLMRVKADAFALGVALLILPLLAMEVTAKLLTDVQYCTILLVMVASLYRNSQLRLDYPNTAIRKSGMR